MADINPRIKVNIDTSDALSSLRALQSEIATLNEKLKKSSALNAQQAETFQRNLLADINATGKFSARMKTIQSSTEAFTESLEKNKLSMGQYFKYGMASTKTFGSLFKNEMGVLDKVARERVKTLQTQFIKMGRDANGALRAISVRPLRLDLNDLATQQAMNAQKQQIFNQLLRQGSTNLLNFGKNTQWAGRQLMVGFTIPLSIFGSQAGRTFMELEEQAIRFKRVYGELFTPPEEADQMLNTLKELSLEFTKYGVAVKDTLSLAADAAAMGKTGADLAAQVSEATRLAVLGEVSQQQALETSISLTNAFGYATGELAGKIDFLNAVENQTVTSIEDLTIAIPKAAPVIQQLGGGVEDLAFFLTAMKEGGINASEGANAIKSGFASMINPTQQSVDLLRAFGIDVRKLVRENGNSARDLVLAMASAFDELAPQQRAQAIEQLFGKFQFSRISTLFSNVIAEGNQASRVLEIMGSTAGELAQLSEKELSRVEESTTYKFRASIEQFQAALAPIGEEFLKLVTPIIEVGTKILESFNKMSDGGKQFVTGLIAILGGVAPVVLMTFGLVANGVANLIKGFATVRSFFLGLTTDSQTLGQGIDYMTQQQLEAAAAAASLEQRHANLLQVFTSEKSAVLALGDAYYNTASKMGMMMGGSAIPSMFSGAKKYAEGGLISGPGSGTSDSIPAMVSNGEFIMSAKRTKQYLPLLKLMAAGKVPGYASTKTGGSVVTSAEGSQYKTVFAHIGDSVTTTMSELKAVFEKMGKAVPAEVSKAIEMGLGGSKVKVYGGLGFDSNQKFNDAMKTGRAGVSPDAFLEDFDSRGLDKWQTSLKIAGTSVEEMGTDLEFLDQEIRRQIQEAASLNDSFAVTDKSMEEFYNNAMKKLRDKGSKLADAMDRAAAAVTEIRGMPTQADLNAAGFTPVPDRPGYSEKDGKQVKRGRGLKKGGGSKDRKQIYGLTFGAFEDGLKEEAQVKSPSKVTKKIGKDTAKGYINGLKEGQSQATKEAVKIGKRRVTTDPAKIQAYREQQRAGVERLFQKQPIATGLIATPAVVAPAVDAFSKFSSVASKATMGLSALTGVVSMFGGQLGEVSSVLFQLSSVSFGLIQIIDMLPANISKIISTRFATAFAGFTSASGIFGKLAAGFTGILRFLGPVGVGLSILAATIPFIVKAFEDFRKSQVGIGSLSGMSADRMSSFGGAVGAQTKASIFDKALPFNVPGISGERTTGASAAIDSLGGIDEFRKQWETEILALQNAVADSPEKVETALSGLSINLFSRGWGEDQVQAMLDALRMAAGVKTDDFQAINPFNDAGKLDLSKIEDFAKLQADTYMGQFADELGAKEAEVNAAIERAMPSYDGVNVTSLQGMRSLAESFKRQIEELTANGDQTGRVLDLQAALEGLQKDIQMYEGQMSFTSLTSFQDVLDGTKGQIASLQSALSDGTIGVDDYSSAVDILINGMTGLFGATESLPALLTSLGMPEDVVAGIDHLDKVVPSLVKAIASGTPIDEELLGDLSSSDINVVTAAISRLTAATTNHVNTQKQLQAADAAAAVLNGIRGQTAALQNQLEKYDLLIAKGVPAALAFKIIGDEALLTGMEIAQANGQLDEWIGLTTDLEKKAAEIAALNPVGAGAGEKSDYQKAIDALRDQTDAANDTYVAYKKLRKAGFDVATAAEAAKDSTIAAALAQTTVGSKNWDTLVRKIREANSALAKTEALLEAIDLATPEGKEAKFMDGFDKAMESFAVLEEQINLDFLRGTNKSGANVDLINTKKLEEDVRDAQETIAGLNYDIDNYDAQLEGITKQEESINKKYDDRVDALDQVAKVNDKIAKQQRAQLSVADALSQGDIAAAARAVQEQRAQEAQQSIDDQKEALQLQREAALARVTSADGSTRAQLEKNIADLKQQIFDIEEKTLEPAQRKLEIADKLKQDAIDSLKVMGHTREYWEALKNRIDIARIGSQGYTDDMTDALGIVRDAEKAWNGIESKEVTLTIVENRVSSGSGSSSSGTSSSTSSSSTSTSGPGSAPTGTAIKTIKAVDEAINSSKARVEAIDNKISSNAKAIKDLKNVPGMSSVVSAMQSQNAKDAYTKSWELKAQAALKDQKASLQSKSAAGVGGATKIGMAAKARGGLMLKSFGSDTIPTLLTPGEFVISRPAVRSFGVDRLRAINSGQNPDGSVYNYNLSVNVKSDANPDEIAQTVMTHIRRVNSQQIRSLR